MDQARLDRLRPGRAPSDPVPSGVLAFGGSALTLSGRVPEFAPEAWFGQALTASDPALSPP